MHVKLSQAKEKPLLSAVIELEIKLPGVIKLLSSEAFRRASLSKTVRVRSSLKDGVKVCKRSRASNSSIGKPANFGQRIDCVQILFKLNGIEHTVH